VLYSENTRPANKNANNHASLRFLFSAQTLQSTDRRDANRDNRLADFAASQNGVQTRQ
jgi:hypothetical protein